MAALPAGVAAAVSAVATATALTTEHSVTEAILPSLFVSVDIEADGQAAGLNSMLALGVAAIDEHGQWIYKYESNLCPLPDAKPDPDTVAWWQQPEQAAALAHIQRDRKEPKEAITTLGRELDALAKRYAIRFVAWPVAFDWQFVNYYMWRFYGRNPFGHAGTDVVSFAWGLLRTKTHRVGKLAEFRDPALPHTHKPLDDAMEQGMVFYNLWKHSQQLKPQENG